MVLSAPATSIQVGLLFHAAVVITALKLSAKLGTCDRAMKPACSAERSAAKYSYLDPAQFHEVTWEALPSSASFSPASGMWAAIYTKPTTDGSVPASVITVPA